MKLSLTLFFTAALWLAAAATAAAHSELVAAEPAPGAHLTASPPEIRLTFSLPLAEGSTISLFNDAFQPIPLAAAIVADNPSQLSAAVPDLADGAYTVQWLTKNTDGHELSGSYRFTVGEEPMLESLAFAETLADSAAFNPPAWYAWLIVVLALVLPLATWIWLSRR